MAIKAKRRTKGGAINISFTLDAKKAIKRLNDLPQELVKGALFRSLEDTADYLMNEYHQEVPRGETGVLASAAVKRPEKYQSPTMVGWSVEIQRQRFRNAYYPVFLEFGWQHNIEGEPFFRQLVQRNRKDLSNVFAWRLAREVERIKEK